MAALQTFAAGMKLEVLGRDESTGHHFARVSPGAWNDVEGRGKAWVLCIELHLRGPQP
eukprot:COSAG04_NODE_25761_length_303_cov_1.117647_1_plen_57_part_01